MTAAAAARGTATSGQRTQRARDRCALKQARPGRPAPWWAWPGSPARRRGWPATGASESGVRWCAAALARGGAEGEGPRQ